MRDTVFHIFRNTPFGRETLLHSAYFCRLLRLNLSVYIPVFQKFLMYFGSSTVQVDLDSSYVKDPSTAREHVREIVAEAGVQADFYQPAEYTASSLPDIPTGFCFMTCPRVISELSSTIRLGRIGSKVRAILKQATFPLLIPSHVFKEWTSVCVMFGGSINGIKALRLGMQIAGRSGLPVDVFTQAEGGKTREDYKEIISRRNLGAEFDRQVRTWHFQDTGDLSSNLYSVPHGALVVMGIYGHGLVKDIVFGNTAEAVHTTLPNSLLLVGPEFRYHHFYSA